MASKDINRPDDTSRRQPMANPQDNRMQRPLPMWQLAFTAFWNARLAHSGRECAATGPIRRARVALLGCSDKAYAEVYATAFQCVRIQQNSGAPGGRAGNRSWLGYSWIEIGGDLEMDYSEIRKAYFRELGLLLSRPGDSPKCA